MPLTDYLRSAERGGAAAQTTVRTVLVVDDSRAQCRTLSALLKRWGYDVHEAYSADQALAISRNLTIDMIISDWIMPGTTGLELCAAYRASTENAYAYFVVLTSKQSVADVAEALEAGADDFLTKPVARAELRARLVAGERIVRMQRELSNKNALLNSTIANLNAAHEALRRDLAEARRFQQSLVAERLMTFPGGRISLLLEPSGDVGGDLVGAFRIGDSRIGLYGLDVSGHGVASGHLAARVASYLSATSPDRNIAMTIDGLGIYAMLPPEEVCRRLNELMLRELETDLYLTMVLADCDLRSGRIRFVQAGHPPPLVQRGGGRPEIVGGGGLPIGLIPGARYRAEEIRLSPGDRFLIYSDGVTECTGPAGAEFGADGLAGWLQSDAMEGGGMPERLVAQLSGHTGGPLEDDVSAALLELLPLAEGE